MAETKEKSAMLLCRFYGDSNAIRYEQSTATDAVLARLYTLNLAEDESALILTQHYKQLAEEYQQQSSHLRKVLSSSGLIDGLCELPSKGVAIDKLIQALAATAATLQLKNMQTATMLAGLADLRLNQAAKAKQDQRTAEQQSRLQQLHIQASRRLQRMKNELEAARNHLASETPPVDELQSTNQLLQFKGDEYKQRITALSKTWSDVNVESRQLLIGQIEQVEAKLRQMNADLKTIDTKLRVFQQLPPDLTLTSLKLAEQAEILNQRKDERDALLKDMLPK